MNLIVDLNPDKIISNDAAYFVLAVDREDYLNLFTANLRVEDVTLQTYNHF